MEAGGLQPGASPEPRAGHQHRSLFSQAWWPQGLLAGCGFLGSGKEWPGVTSEARTGVLGTAAGTLRSNLEGPALLLLTHVTHRVVNSRSTKNALSRQGWVPGWPRGGVQPSLGGLGAARGFSGRFV